MAINRGNKKSGKKKRSCNSEKASRVSGEDARTKMLPQCSESLLCLVYPQWPGMVSMNDSLLNEMGVDGFDPIRDNESYCAVWDFYDQLPDDFQRFSACAITDCFWIAFLQRISRVARDSMSECEDSKGKNLGEWYDGMFLCVQGPRRRHDSGDGNTAVQFYSWDKLGPPFYRPSSSQRALEGDFINSLSVFDGEEVGSGSRAVLGFSDPSKTASNLRQFIEGIFFPTKRNGGRLSSVSVRGSDDDQESICNNVIDTRQTIEKRQSTLYSGSMVNTIAFAMWKSLCKNYEQRLKSQGEQGTVAPVPILQLTSDYLLPSWNYYKQSAKENASKQNQNFEALVPKDLFATKMVKWMGKEDSDRLELLADFLAFHSERIADSLLKFEEKTNKSTLFPRKCRNAKTDSRGLQEPATDDSTHMQSSSSPDRPQTESKSSNAKSNFPGIRKAAYEASQLAFTRSYGKWEQVTSNNRRTKILVPVDSESEPGQANQVSQATALKQEPLEFSHSSHAKTSGVKISNTPLTTTKFSTEQAMTRKGNVASSCAAQSGATVERSGTAVPQSELRCGSTKQLTESIVRGKNGAKDEEPVNKTKKSKKRPAERVLAKLGPNVRGEAMSMLSSDINEMADMLEDAAAKRKASQLETVDKIESIVKVVFPQSCIVLFGSLATGLAAPCSDIDLVIRYASLETISINILTSRLNREPWVQQLCFVRNTFMPIIRLAATHTQTSSSQQRNLTRVDISFETIKHRGPQASALTRSMLRAFPPLKPLALILKQFLVQKALNDPFCGGLSSYGLVLMIIRILQRVFPEGMSPEVDFKELLGPLFALFLKEYSIPDFVQNGVWIYPTGLDFLSEQARLQHDNKNQAIVRQMASTAKGPLYILDPLDSGNNVGRSCFGVHQVIQAFSEAYSAIETASVATSQEYKDSPESYSILGNVFSTGHHSAVANFVKQVWCPVEEKVEAVEKPLNNMDMYDWSIAAKALLESFETRGSKCPECNKWSHESKCVLRSLIGAFPKRQLKQQQ